MEILYQDYGSKLVLSLLHGQHDRAKLDEAAPRDRVATGEGDTTSMISANGYPALVLNADFRPLSYFPLSLWSWQEAVNSWLAAPSAAPGTKEAWSV